ncbi:MAG TPA: hypothetical protein VG273_17860 [Bryobacteraceae bacterium]|nr:hypothetical protein [Bryobacteraceae bacterium]
MNLAAFGRLAASLSLIASLAGAADLPSGEDLLAIFLERSGGAEAYARAKTVEMTGTVEIAGRNIGGKVSMIEQGKKSWTSMDLPGIGPIEIGYNGDTAWENSTLQGPRIIEGQEKSAMERSSSFVVATEWRDQYKSVKTTGEDTVDGKPAWKVEMTPKDGNPETFYFDKDSGLLLRIATVMSSPLGEIATDMTLSDYRLVDGIRTPFTMTQNAMGQNIVMKFDKVIYNGPLAPGRFDPPEAVKALLAKQAK